MVPKVGEEGQRAVGLRGEPSVLQVPEAGQELRPEYPVPGWVRISQFPGLGCVCVYTHTFTKPNQELYGCVLSLGLLELRIINNTPF